MLLFFCPKFHVRKVLNDMLPKSVRVAGIDYKVQEVVEFIGEPEMLGCVIYPFAQIRVKESLPADKKWQVFIHELLHAIFMEAGFEEHDEEMVNRLGIVLHQVLKDNEIDCK